MSREGSRQDTMQVLVRFLFIGCFFGSVWATPVTSAYYAQKWLDNQCQHYDEEEKKAFLLGALFPNFSYLQVTVPTSPDEGVCTFEYLREGDNPFECGRVFHELFYRFRERIIVKTHVYDHFDEDADKDLLLKMLEDEAYHDDIDIKHVKSCLSEVTGDEESTGVPYHTLRTCHRLMSQYYGMTPQSILRRLRQFGMGLFGVSSTTVAEWAGEFANLMESEAFQCYLAEVDYAFEQSFLNGSLARTEEELQ